MVLIAKLSVKNHLLYSNGGMSQKWGGGFVTTMGGDLSQQPIIVKNSLGSVTMGKPLLYAPPWHTTIKGRIKTLHRITSSFTLVM